MCPTILVRDETWWPKTFTGLFFCGHLNGKNHHTHIYIRKCMLLWTPYCTQFTHIHGWFLWRGNDVEGRRQGPALLEVGDPQLAAGKLPLRVRLLLRTHRHRGYLRRCTMAQFHAFHKFSCVQYEFVSKSIGSVEFWYTICPRSLDTFYIVSYVIKWVKTSWIYSIKTPSYSFDQLFLSRV